LKTKNISVHLVAGIALILLAVFPQTNYAQDRDTVWLSYGSPGGAPINVDLDQRVLIDVWFLGQPDVYVADACWVLAADMTYIDSMLSQTEGVFLPPLSNWEVHEFTRVYTHADHDSIPPGWMVQSFLGFARVVGEGPWLHFSTQPWKVLQFVVKTANDPNNVGALVPAINRGFDPFQGPSNSGDTLGGSGYVMIEEFSTFQFSGGGWAVGTVSDYQGSPIEDVMITDNISGRITHSAGNGTYRFGLAPGAHDLSFSCTGYIDTTVSGVQITLDQDTPLDLTMHQMGIINGTVSNVQGGAVQGIIVQLVGQGVSDTTDADGAYSFGSLMPGTYDLLFTNPDYQDTTVTGVQAEYDATITVDVTIHMLGAVIGTVRNASNNPVQGAIVALDGTQDVTDAQGHFDLLRLSAGVYDLTVTHDDYVTMVMEDLTVELDSTIELSITLHRLGGIAGVVTDTSSGAYLAGVIVTLEGTSHIDTTNAQGIYSLTNVEPGTYTLLAEKQDYDPRTITDVNVQYDNTTVLNFRMGEHVGIADNTASIPDVYSINQNYPNPFNAATTIKYGLPENGHVTVEVYDLLGRRVTTLVNEYQDAGYHQVTWNAGRYTSGTYFYRIQANDYSEQKRMLLVK
jgi:hypothetical protein